MVHQEQAALVGRQVLQGQAGLVVHQDQAEHQDQAVLQDQAELAVLQEQDLVQFKIQH
jgi:hypothetical protein